MIVDLLKAELARADSIIHESGQSNKKPHGPTIDNFKGQSMAYRKAITWLEMEKITPRGPLVFHHNFAIPWKTFFMILLTGYIVCGIIYT